MKELVYITANPDTMSELRSVVSGVLVTARRTESLPADDIIAIAKKLASDAWFETGKPVLAILTDVYFDSPSSPYSPFPDMSEADLFAYAAGHKGRLGVMRIVFAFTENGAVLHTDERDVPGMISASPRGAAGTQIDRLWIPNGYRYTISELIECQPHLNRRERAYRIAGTLLGAATAQEIYEAHITVEVPAGGTYQTFQDACSALGIKAIHLELSVGNNPTHFITGSIHRGQLAGVESEVEGLAQRLQEAGLRPTRRKIEAMVQNSLVPLTDEEASHRQRSNYFEFHTKVTLRDNQEITELQAVCRDFGAHLARSGSNRLGTGYTQRFVTLRFHDKGLSTAELVFTRLIEKLREFGYQPSHILKEYVVIDTNLDLDAGWADSAVPADCYSNCAHLEANRCPFQSGSGHSTHQALVNFDEVT